MPIDYTHSARGQDPSHARKGEPSAEDAPTLAEGVHAALADELFVLHAWAADEDLSAEMRADAAMRIPGIEQLDATVMDDTTTWRYPLAWHDAIYREALLAGYSVFSATGRALDLSLVDAATARTYYARALHVLADHAQNS